MSAEYLLAAVGSSDQLQVLSEQILDPDAGWRMETADHAALTGSLQFVETFIQGYRIAFGETTRSAMEDGLSNLLVTDPESRFVVDCLLASDPAAGEDRLRRAARDKSEEFGPRVCLDKGLPMTLGALVATMIGFSQDGMFKESDDGMQNQWNEVLIKAQLERASQLPYEAGTRYFFGHPAAL